MSDTSPLPAEIVEQLVARWGGEEGSAALINKGTNAVFGFRAGANDLILRIHHTGDRTRKETEAEVNWVDFLHRHGVKVGWPVASIDGQWVETLEWEGKDLIATVYQKMPGRHPQLSIDKKWRTRLIRNIGRTLGRMHALNRSYEPPEGLDRFDWSQIDLPRFAEGIAPAEETAYLENLRAHWRWVQSLPRDDPESFGLVHGDFHAANLLAKGSKVAVIDFDGVCYNWYLFDIAHFIGNSILTLGPLKTEERQERARILFQEFMRGYVKENRMRSDWFEFFPSFLRGFQLLYYFNLLANFQSNKEQREKAPHYKLVRKNVLNDLPLVELDFRKLYKEVERSKFMQWVIKHVIIPSRTNSTAGNSHEGAGGDQNRTSAS